MTPSQLRQWSFQNNQPDQWWLCLDAVTEEIPVTVAEIENLLATGEYARAQVLHTSQAETAYPLWIDVAMPAGLAAPPTVESAMAALALLEQTQEAERVRLQDERVRFQAEQVLPSQNWTWGDLNLKMICPHCQTTGKIYTKQIVQKKGISGAKATGVLLTAGFSIWATGLSRKEQCTQAHCVECKSTWTF
jgi:hypothetical protein